MSLVPQLLEICDRLEAWGPGQPLEGLVAECEAIEPSEISAKNPEHLVAVLRLTGVAAGVLASLMSLDRQALERDPSLVDLGRRLQRAVARLASH